MGKSLDELNCSEGPASLAEHLTSFGWDITPPEPGALYSVARKPGTGIELIIPAPDPRTGRVRLNSRVLALIGE